MKKYIVFIIVLVCAVTVVGCLFVGHGTDENVLTMKKVKQLAKKGQDLTWSDFEKYESREIGSGLYILVYTVDENYNLMIGGVPDDKPMYIRLVSADDMGHYIDIRTDDIEAFINE